MSASVYDVRYVKKANIENGKFDAENIETYSIAASNATRAISAVKRALVEAKETTAEGDIKIISSTPVVNPSYVIKYVKKEDIENGKFDPEKVETINVRASDATRAISAAKKELIETKAIKEKGDITIFDVRPEF